MKKNKANNIYEDFCPIIFFFHPCTKTIGSNSQFLKNAVAEKNDNLDRSEISGFLKFHLTNWP